MSKNKQNNLPQIKYDFARVTDRRREARPEKHPEIYFRDATAIDNASLWLCGKSRDRN